MQEERSFVIVWILGLLDDEGERCDSGDAALEFFRIEKGVSFLKHFESWGMRRLIAYRNRSYLGWKNSLFSSSSSSLKNEMKKVSLSSSEFQW